MSAFTNGINLGGWLSQFGDKGHEHFASFITERDIQQIASWGLDHVRLPVDYQVIESDDAPGVPVERGYGYIDSCIDWCERAGLGVILDLHEAPGFTFNNSLEVHTEHLNTLFTDAATQDRFVRLWETIAGRYASAPVPLILELLNEVTLPTNDRWNQVAARAHAAVRAVAPQTTIMYGGTHNNAVKGLEGLVVVDDPNTVYTFHTYEPLLFTHQNAPWLREAREWGATHAYPGELLGLGAFLDANPEYAAKHEDVVGRRLDRAYLEDVIAPAVAFSALHGRQVYCGEFGVADWIEPADRRNWLRDFLDILGEYGIGRALWTYKQMDFGVVDSAGQVIDPAYLQILRESA